MKKIKFVFLSLLVGMSCKHTAPVNKKLAFLVRDFMMCNADTKLSANSCPTLSFMANQTGSIRTTKSVDIPFVWSVKNNYLLIRPLQDNKIKSEFINNKVYKILFSREPYMDERTALQLIDTTTHEEYAMWPY